MQPGVFQILVVALILLLLFGRGRISDSLGELGKGVKAFRRGRDEGPQLPVEIAAEPAANPADN